MATVSTMQLSRMSQGSFLLGRPAVHQVLVLQQDEWSVRVLDQRAWCIIPIITPILKVIGSRRKALDWNFLSRIISEIILENDQHCKRIEGVDIQFS
jgi:hypothetical protein